MTSAAEDRFVKLADVMDAIGVGRSSIYALMQERNPDLRFPQPVKIGHRSRWRESEVRAWMQRQVERSANAA